MDKIEITLDGSPIELSPSLKAAQKLSAKYGGLIPLSEMMALGHLDAMTDVVFWATGAKDTEREAVQANVYGAGLNYLQPHLVRYVVALANGGKVPPEAKPEQVEYAD